MRDRPQKPVNIDGIPRTAQGDEQINDICRAALNTPAGERLMDYLRSITASVVMPPSASDAELRDLEGMRRLHGILDYRRKTTPKE
ncbi:hypothetical protein [Poseidonocella sp. HB161398]|uniref:hypothetical protein n=1 Tax=Poseidonocella sp. HB161398 TaxID=2320855 RepID=UPI0011097101|nr:hypothetical protein [Poseidonocella sp. HB161398]